MHISHQQCQHLNRRNQADVVTHVTYQLNFCDYGFGIADGRYALRLVALQPCASCRSVSVTHSFGQSAVSKLVVLAVDTLICTLKQNSGDVAATTLWQHEAGSMPSMSVLLECTD